MKWCSVALPESGSRCVVGMSGGVDSSLVTKLLLEKGCHVIGVTMSTWANDMPLPPSEKGIKESCYGPDEAIDIAQCKAFCNDLGIEHYTINVSDAYHREVLEYFKREYRQGKTPNPCVRCNPTVKFGALLDGVKALGIEFDYFCTGHYADLVRPEKDIRELYGISPDSGAVNRPVMIRTAADSTKDQTYFLNQLSQEQLKNTLFPLADIEKPDLRKIAQKHNFVNASKKDSTGVCFIGERHFRQFLKQYIPMQKGDIVDTNNRVVGKHDGVYYYTIGQRRGLNIGGMSTGNGKRWYVIGKDVEKNILYVSQGEGEELYSKGLVTYKVNWIPKEPANKKFDCFAKFRYRQPDQAVSVEILKDKVLVHFKEKQRAVTEGQFVVFYDKDENCLGGGVIEEVIK